MEKAIAVLICSPVLLSTPHEAVARDDVPVRAGWAELVVFAEIGLELPAKLDTGARHSSLHALEIQTFERDGASWVRFTLPDQDGNIKTVARPLYRTAVIRRAGTGVEKRPVVLLRACVAGFHRTVEFNLKDRSGMLYPVLIGRSFLGSRILVDSSRKSLGTGRCRTAD